MVAYAKINVGGKLVFVVPTYAWRIPRIVEEWIAKTKFTGHVNTYFVMNCGDTIENDWHCNARELHCQV
ncbi:hypothetical protein [Clostridium estertheticum]|uniref:hypothetical protein n=1 Tax=Clostridium estertheticum TaxID=238834 RepID=UPI001CF4F0F4|nr:hypothetical protein [Clostridium estertheticum]MCB2362304.1 hypothetical protein [Clostridium estertheticum]